jgi:serine/threonine-protein kinase
MAAVHYGRLLGAVGFARTVAIKRLHAGIAADPENAAMFLDEARLSARIHHPNVVPTIDVIEHGTELLLVMDYVAGPSLSGLLRIVGKDDEDLPMPHAVAMILGALHGLHAAHEAKGAKGEPLDIVHRDVSPQNIIVGDDGVARLIDFGIAKAVERVHETRGNEIRGKILYMSPEQLARQGVDRRADIYALTVVLWELLAGRRLIDLGSGEDPILAIEIVRNYVPVPPSQWNPDCPPALDAVVMKGLARDPFDRYPTALDMATALEAAMTPSSQRELGIWVKRVAAELLQARAAALRAIEQEGDADGHVVGRVEISMPPPMPSSRATFTINDQHTGQVWAHSDPPKKGLDARGPVALALVVVAIVVAWVAGTQRGAAAVAPPPAPIPTASVVELPTDPSPPPIQVNVPDAAPWITTGDDAPTPTQKRRPNVRPPPPRAKCDPPYTVDAKGVRVPKPECR